MYTFTITLGLEDDFGASYSPDWIERYVQSSSHAKSMFSLFTIARGNGIDTDTDQKEPVLVLQGFCSSETNLINTQDYFRGVAESMRQRGFGWFQSSHGSYAYTDIGQEAMEYEVEGSLT